MNVTPICTGTTKDQLEAIRAKVQVMRRTSVTGSATLNKAETILARAEFETVLAKEQIRVTAAVELEMERARKRIHDRDNNAGECCPICLDDLLPLDFSGMKGAMFVCCGKRTCWECADKWDEKRADGTCTNRNMNECPLCKTIQPKEHERVPMLQKHVETGKGWAMNILSVMYREGAGGLKDNKNISYDLCLKAAKEGIADAQYEVARGYFDGERHGINFTKSETQTLHWARAAANQGHKDAQHLIGALHEIGQGVSINKDEAYRMYTLSAYQGNSEAACSLGKYVVMEQTNTQQVRKGMAVAKNVDSAQFNLAIYWFGKAAECGDTFGMANLVFQLLYGLSHWHKYAETDTLTGCSPLPLMMWLVRKIKASNHSSTSDAMDRQVIPVLKQYQDFCACCTRRPRKLSGCSQCKVFHYCNRKCQSKHWKEGHKKDCGGHWIETFFPNLRK